MTTTVTVDVTVTQKPHYPNAKVGTKLFEDKLLGLIQLGNHASVTVLAKVMSTGRHTILKQLYYWAWNKQHLNIICRVNWKWNKNREIPDHFLEMFLREPGMPGRPKLTEEYLDNKFRKAVSGEIKRQAENGNAAKVVELATFVGEYFDDTL